MTPKSDINKQSTMNGGQFLDSHDAASIIKAFVLEKLNVYEPCVVDVEVWNPVLFARYQDQHLHFQRSYIGDLAAKFCHWVAHGKNLPDHVIECITVNLEDDEEGVKQYCFLGGMVLYGPNPAESNGCSEEEADEGGWLLVHVPAPPAAPSDDGWEMLELPAASDDDCL